MIIGDQTFLKELILDECIQCFILGTLTFFKVDFKRVDFLGSTFVNCKFKNCRFKDVIFHKCEFWNPTFENCQIERSNLTRASFHKGTFQDCIFVKADASDFSELEFINTKFNKSKLDLIGARSIKVWKSNQLTTIDDSLNLGNFLEVEDTISDSLNEASK